MEGEDPGRLIPVRPSLEVADIFRIHGSAWRAAHARHVSLAQLKVMSAIEGLLPDGTYSAAMSKAARTAATARIAYNSCRNRHCPKCQGAAARRWLRRARSRPAASRRYFHVVFTVPAEIADIAFHNKAAV